jgi:DNA replication protein DnaC
MGALTDRIDLPTVRGDVVCAACQKTFTRDLPVNPVTGRPFGGRYECEACHAERTAQEAVEAREQATRMQVERCRNALSRLAAPELFADATIDGMEVWGSPPQRANTSRAIQVARRMVGELSGGLRPPPFVAFFGAPGTGKTHLLWAIGAELAGKYAIPSRVVRLSALVRDLRGAWRVKDGPSEDERLEGYVAPEYLGIDEVSRHAFYGQQIHQHLWDVINARLEHGRPTAISTNETEAGLAEILGAALMDRLALGGLVDCGTESYRRRRAA